jgi:hypothetical protein
VSIGAPAAAGRSTRRSPGVGDERGERVGDGLLGELTAQLARLDQRDERRRRVLVDLDERVLVLDRREVGVRADGGRASR